jgi:hypothetical protein
MSTVKTIGGGKKHRRTQRRRRTQKGGWSFPNFGYFFTSGKSTQNKTQTPPQVATETTQIQDVVSQETQNPIITDKTTGGKRRRRRHK